MKEIYKQMKLSLLTLSFPKEIEEKYQEYFLNDSIKIFRIAFVVLVFLYGIFGFLDWIVAGENLNYFLYIRYLVVIPFLLFVLFLSYTKHFIKIWQYLILMSFLLGGAGIIIMLLFVPDDISYYGGLMLVFFAGYFFIKIRFIMAAIGGITLLVIFNATFFYLMDNFFELMLKYNFFFISANIIGMFGAYYLELINRRNYWLNINLQTNSEKLSHLNLLLDEQIKIKSRDLEEHQTKITALFEEMTDMVVLHEVVFNEKGEAINYVITDCNKAFTRVTGIAKEDAINKTADVVYNSSEPPFLKDFTDVALSNNPLRFETYYEAMSKYFRISVVPIGKNRFATITDDITERKKAVEELVETNSQLERQYEEYMQLNEVLRQTNYDLELAKEKAEESDRLKTAFLQNVSHEIRTPINEIIGLSKLITMEVNNESKEEYIQLLNQSTTRLLNTVDDIIRISKIDSGLTEIIKYECMPLNIINNIYDYYYHYFNGRNVELRIVIEKKYEEMVIISDEKIIYQIINSFVNNALKFTSSGYCEIGFYQKDKEIEFFVRDTGIGIPETSIKKIFERFYQADLSISRGYEGSGLGLAIAKGLADVLGGKIWVESEIGKGSTFYFSLPS
ncbi:MAG: hypothetical protein KIT33_12465 [Candidatus Kapabacteria bacterium]|nr:hypothetical protein [Ignavibacteriota bacterium]MCW5885774.1 hypothetical protein [Candidatus Kapabacteria bacterium]